MFPFRVCLPFRSFLLSSSMTFSYKPLITGEEIAPDLFLLGSVEVLVIQGELYAGFEGFVECADPVGGED